jgi:hypothetical protein
MKLPDAHADRAQANGLDRQPEICDRRRIAGQVEMSAIPLRPIPAAIRPDA